MRTIYEHYIYCRNGRQPLIFFLSLSANYVGKCVVDSINSGKNGSVWLVENCKIKQLEMQDYPEIDFHKNML